MISRSPPFSTYEIKTGWEIPAVLEPNLNSDLPGDIKALISSNVFDTAASQFLLIPQSSRLVGKYQSGISYGQDDVQVIWGRIIFPDASSVDINGMVGQIAHGNSPSVTTSINTTNGCSASWPPPALFSPPSTSPSGIRKVPCGDTASAAVGREMSRTGEMITRRNLHVQPTIKVPAGYKFTVRVNRDILFDAPYQPMEANPLPAQPPGQLHRRTAFVTAGRGGNR